MMIKHLQRARNDARAGWATARAPNAKQLAQQIVEAHNIEIDTMPRFKPPLAEPDRQRPVRTARTSPVGTPHCGGGVRRERVGGPRQPEQRPGIEEMQRWSTRPIQRAYAALSSTRNRGRFHPGHRDALGCGPASRRGRPAAGNCMERGGRPARDEDLELRAPGGFAGQDGYDCRHGAGQEQSDETGADPRPPSATGLPNQSASIRRAERTGHRGRWPRSRPTASRDNLTECGTAIRTAKTIKHAR